MAARRKRVTVDLHGLGAAIGAHADANQATVSALIRRAVAELLERSGVTPASPVLPTTADDRELVSMTIRMRAADAQKMVLRAEATGLSRGAYVSLLMDSTPVNSSGERPADAVRALAASTSELAILAADLHRVIRLLRDGNSPPSAGCEAMLAMLDEEVRGHLERASRLLVDLAPIASLRRLSRNRTGGESVAP